MHVSSDIFGTGYALGRRCNAEQNCVWLQEEEALLNEMEVTGQAFEDMQEQNSRLIQQLREKDDANFKLMTERIKSNQLHKLAREEKDVLKEQVITLTTQVEAANVVVRKLEEKERLLQNSLATVEKELALRQQAMEMHKRKAIESAQSAADLKLHLGKRTFYNFYSFLLVFSMQSSIICTFFYRKISFPNEGGSASCCRKN